MKGTVKLLTSCLLTLGLVIPSVASATNGYMLIGFGAKSRGMGGVGVAYGQDGLAAAFNPAAMIQVKKTRVDLGLDLFVPTRSATHISDTLPVDDQESGHNLFPIPNFGGIYKFNRNLRMGMAVVGAGLGTRYSQGIEQGNGISHFFNFNDTAGRDELGVFLIQVQMLPSIAYQFHKSKKWGRHTIGASLVIGVQTFRARGLGSFREGALGYASGSTKLTDNGFDWSFGGGVRVGWLGEFMKRRLTFGANYSSRVYMTQFEDYSELFAEKGGFDIPENYAFGAAFKATDKVTVVGEIQRIMYGDVASVSNPGPNALDATDIFELCPLGGPIPQSECKTGEDRGLGFGWENQTVYKLGVDYKHNKKWTFRGGVNYAKSPIPSDQVLFNTLAPATVEWHSTVGVSYRPSKGSEWTFSWVHGFENEITGPTPFPPVGAAPGEVDNGAISLEYDALGIGWGIEI